MFVGFKNRWVTWCWFYLQNLRLWLDEDAPDAGNKS